jgi:hypothetical protein
MGLLPAKIHSFRRNLSQNHVKTETPEGSLRWHIFILFYIRHLTMPYKSSNISEYTKLYPALYRKSNLCIPRNETAQRRSQFLHSCTVSVSDLYIPRQIGRPILEIYKSLTDTSMWKLGD